MHCCPLYRYVSQIGDERQMRRLFAFDDVGLQGDGIVAFLLYYRIILWPEHCFLKSSPAERYCHALPLDDDPGASLFRERSVAHTVTLSSGTQSSPFESEDL